MGHAGTCQGGRDVDRSGGKPDRAAMPGHRRSRRVSADMYSQEYLLSDDVEGYAEYQAGMLSALKQKQLEMLAPAPGLSLLEIGFGRGEFLRHCARRCGSVTGIDYSPAACQIARQTLRETAAAGVLAADCRQLPFPAESFDRVYSGDVIEHLDFQDGILMLREAYRVLKPHGFLLIHTSPNSVFIRFVYPIARIVLRHMAAPTVEAIDRHLATGKQVHLFEFNQVSLRRIAREAGLPDARVWIDRELLRGGQHRHTRGLDRHPVMRFAGALGRFSVVRFFLGNDLYLKCAKPSGVNPSHA